MVHLIYAHGVHRSIHRDRLRPFQQRLYGEPSVSPSTLAGEWIECVFEIDVT